MEIDIKNMLEEYAHKYMKKFGSSFYFSERKITEEFLTSLKEKLLEMLPEEKNQAFDHTTNEWHKQWGHNSCRTEMKGNIEEVFRMRRLKNVCP